MRNRFSRATALALMLSLAATAFAQGGSRAGNAQTGRAQTRQATAARPNLAPIPIEQFTLRNGLRVVLNRDTTAPVIGLAIFYDVGSRNERPGRTGFAHLFEHMMFEGSQNIPDGAHDAFISRAGGVHNATTNTERTYYFINLPANQLPLALWLESDRMRALNVTQETLDIQRRAVQEEKRLRVDNQPYVPSDLHLDEMIFRNFANAHSVIGSMEDLEAASLDDVRDFFRIYYAPNNAVLALSGDFEIAAARRLIEQYFGNIPRQPAPPAINVTEPAEVARRSDRVTDQFARLPAFRIGWKIPARRTPEFYALQFASQILMGGQSSRLYRRLVKGDETVLQIGGGIDARRGPSGMGMFVLPKPGQEAEAIRRVIFEEINRLATEGPTAEEMDKVRNNLIANNVRGRESAQGRAGALALYAMFDGDPNLYNTEIDNLLRVTSDQVKAAVARYLNTENRAVLDIIPASAQQPGGQQQRPGTQPGGQQPQRPATPAQPAPSPSATPQTTRP